MGQFKRSDFEIKNKHLLDYLNHRLKMQQTIAAEALVLYKKDEVKRYVILLELKELVEAASYKGLQITELKKKIEAAPNRTVLQKQLDFK